jgi:hypothetical protein
VILVVAALVALGVALFLVLPEMRAAERLRAHILETDAGELEARLDNAPASHVAAVDAHDRMLAEVYEAASREATAARSRVRESASVFADDLEAWRRERRDEGILAKDAWPPAPGALPTMEEIRRTIRMAALVESLGRTLRDGAGGRITRVDPNRAELDISFDPERAGILVDALTTLALGGERFELTRVEATVPESGPGSAVIRLRWPEEES